MVTSTALCARDAIAESLHYEALAATYRLIATEAFHALHAAKQREDSLAEQCAALRLELRAARCAIGDRQP